MSNIFYLFNFPRRLIPKRSLLCSMRIKFIANLLEASAKLANLLAHRFLLLTVRLLDLVEKLLPKKIHSLVAQTDLVDENFDKLGHVLEGRYQLELFETDFEPVLGHFADVKLFGQVLVGYPLEEVFLVLEHHVGLVRVIGSFCVHDSMEVLEVFRASVFIFYFVYLPEIDQLDLAIALLLSRRRI